MFRFDNNRRFKSGGGGIPRKKGRGGGGGSSYLLRVKKAVLLPLWVFSVKSSTAGTFRTF